MVIWKVGGITFIFFAYNMRMERDTVLINLRVKTLHMLIVAIGAMIKSLLKQVEKMFICLGLENLGKRFTCIFFNKNYN